MSEIVKTTTENYIKRITGFDLPYSIIESALLFDETKRISGGELIPLENANDVYNLMYEAAYRLHLDPPGDRESLYNAFNVYRDFSDDLDFEFLYYLTEQTKLGFASDALYKEFEARFNDNASSVLLAESTSFVPNLKKLVDNHPNCHFTLTESKFINYDFLKKIFYGCENVNLACADVYSYEFVEERFDLILCIPLFGVRNLAEDPNFMCKELDCVALENLLLHTSANGELLITMPARISYAQGRIGELRRFIEQNYKINEISELPEGAFYGVGIKTILLNIVNVRAAYDDDIIVRKYISPVRQNNRKMPSEFILDNETFVMTSELEEQGDWNTGRVFAQQDEDLQKYENSTLRRDSLGVVSYIFRGKAITEKDPTGSIAVLNISNVGEYEIDYDSLDHIDEDERKVSRYLLEEGDVVIPARGTVIRSAVYHDHGFPCIASANIIVIRPDAQILNSDYLKLFLGSPIGKKLISGRQQGMSVISISYKDIFDLEIPVPSMELQLEKVQEYQHEYERYSQAVKAAQDRWNEALTRINDFS